MAAIASTQPAFGHFRNIPRYGAAKRPNGRWESPHHMTTSVSIEGQPRRLAEGATFSIILALSFSHFLNDTMQSLVPALYPMLKDTYSLSFAQVGLITATMQVTSSLLQPA